MNHNQYLNLLIESKSDLEHLLFEEPPVPKELYNAAKEIIEKYHLIDPTDDTVIVYLIAAPLGLGNFTDKFHMEQIKKVNDEMIDNAAKLITGEYSYSMANNFTLLVHPEEKDNYFKIKPKEKDIKDIIKRNLLHTAQMKMEF